MTDEQKSKVAALKSAITASGPASAGAPAEVRAAVLALKEELRQAGTTARELAKDQLTTRPGGGCDARNSMMSPSDNAYCRRGLFRNPRAPLGTGCGSFRAPTSSGSHSGRVVPERLLAQMEAPIGIPVPARAQRAQTEHGLCSR